MEHKGRKESGCADDRVAWLAVSLVRQSTTMDPSFDFLVFPNDSSTPTTDTFSFPSFSLDTDDPALPSASAWEDSAQLDPLLYQQAFADGNPYAEEFDTGGIELGAIGLFLPSFFFYLPFFSSCSLARSLPNTPRTFSLP